MAGLRAKNKADRQARILKAATRQFRNQGYDASRIEAIAAEAEVSVGTIYNYYENKGDILVAIVSMEVNEVLAAGQLIIDKPPGDASKAVNALIKAYIGHALVYLSKDMWRQAMAISIRQPDSPFGRTYAALDRALADQTCALVAKLKSLGLVRRDVDCTGAGELIFNNTNMMFIEFVKRQAMTISQLRAAIRRQTAALVAAIKT